MSFRTGAPAVVIALALLSACGERGGQSERPTPEQLSANLQAEARSLQSQLPVRVDEVTEIVGVEVEGTQVIYTVQASAPFPEGFQASEESQLAGRFCGNPQSAQIIRQGGSARYDYTDSTGSRFSVPVTSCP